MNCAQLSRRANELKKQLSEGQGDLRVVRYNLQNVYRELLVTDLEYALDKKLEQELWNNIFKNHISSLQAKVRDKMNPKRSELQSMLTLTLDSATGFFLQLLHELCSAFDLELPFCVKATRFGVTKKLRKRFQKVVIPQISSCLYICQYCLVHLGDLARYRNDNDQAHMYYNHAVTLIPTNGQPYNQLAIVSAGKSDQLSMAFYYIRSIAVKHPFPAALTNLQSTFSKLVDRDEMKIFKMRDVELIHYFIKFHAVIYMAGGETDLKIASTIKTKLEENFRDHLSQDSLTARQLVQIMAINIFALSSIKQLDENGVLASKRPEDGVTEQDHFTDTADEEQCWKLTLDLMLTLTQLLLYHTPGSAKERLTWQGLPAIRVLLEWLQHHQKVLADETVTGKYLFWNRLGKLLSMLSEPAAETAQKNQSVLWEDLLLNGFRPLQEAHSLLDFSSPRAKHLTKEESNRTRVVRMIHIGAKLASIQPGLLLMKKGESTSFISPQHDAQAELDKTLYPKSSKTAALPLRQRSLVGRGPRNNSVGSDGATVSHDGEDADDDEGDDEEDDDDDDEFEEMEKMTVGTQVIEPKSSSKSNRVSFKLEKNMVIPPPSVSQPPRQTTPPNHPSSQQNRPHFPPHMPRGYPVHYPRQGPPQQMAPHQGTYPPRSGWNQPTMPPRPQYQNFRGPRPGQQPLGPQAPPPHGPHMPHGPPMHHGPQQHHGPQTQVQHGPQPPHGPPVPHGPQAPHGGQHMPPQIWQQQPPPPRHMPPFMGNQAGPRYTGPLPTQNRQSMSPQNYPNSQPQISRESPVEGEQSHDNYPSQQQQWNTQMMPPGRGYVRNGPMRMPQEEGRMLEPAEREQPTRQFDNRQPRGMAQFRQSQEFNPTSYSDMPPPRSPFSPDGGPPKSSPFGHVERTGPVGKHGVDAFYDQRGGQGNKEEDQGGYMNFLNNIHQGDIDGAQHQRGTNLRQPSAMDPQSYQKPFFNNQRKSSGDEFGAFSPHQMPSPNARSPNQAFFDDSNFNSMRQPNGEVSRQRKNGSPWNDAAQVSSSFMHQSDQPSPGIGKQEEPLALLQQLMTPTSEASSSSSSSALGRSNWSLGTDDRMTQGTGEPAGFAGGRTNRTPPFAPSWPLDTQGSWAGGQELQFGDPYPSSPQEFLNQDNRVVGRRQSGSLTDGDSSKFFGDSSYSLFSSPSPWSDKSKRDSLGGTSPFGSLHQREEDKQQGSSNLFGGLGWTIPPPDQISGSPTSTLLPERIQSIWSSPVSSGGVEPPGMEKLMRDKPET